MRKILFLCSGNGGTARTIYLLHKLINKQPYCFTVMVDRQCGACSLTYEFPDLQFIKSDTKSFDDDLISIYKRMQPDYVITTTHRITCDICEFIGARLINVTILFFLLSRG